MSDFDKFPKPEWPPAPVAAPQVQAAQPEQSQIIQLERSINDALQNSSHFPVRYEPPAELLKSVSGRMKLSIVRTNLERTWDVKEINVRLNDQAPKQLVWVINVRKALEPVKVKKDEDDDDFNFKDVFSPMKF